MNTSKTAARPELNSVTPVLAKTIQNMNVYTVCPTHNNFEITNICLSPGCLEPLCPECAKIHLRVHYDRKNKCELETIHGARLTEYDKIQKELRSLKEMREELTSFKNQRNLKIFEGCLQKIERAKEKLQAIVANYFSTLENGIKRSIDVYLAGETEGNEKALQENLNKNITKVEKLIKKIESPEYLRSLLKLCVNFNSPKVMSRNYFSSWDELRGKVQKSLEHFRNDIVDVVVDESKLFSINIELGKYISVEALEKTMNISYKNTKMTRGKPELASGNLQEIVDKRDFDELMSIPERAREQKVEANEGLKDWHGWEEFAEDSIDMEKLLMPDANRNEKRENERSSVGGTHRSNIFKEEPPQYIDPDKLRQNYGYFNPGYIQNKFDNSQRSKILLKK